MCVVCGCGGDAAKQPEQVHAHAEGEVHHHGAGHAHDHDHARGHAHDHGEGDLHYGQNAARVSVPGLSPERAIQIERSVLDVNNRFAAENRAHFDSHGVLALNLVSSPGSGKTTLLVETLRRLRATTPNLATAVIEGDQQTTFDADRIRATGVPAIQVNTGKGCHLDAQMVSEAFARLPLHDAGGVLFIENVGNLVCPASWDLGEAAKVAVLSVTEGEDKPLKYPDMFAAASLVLLNKIDLLPYVSFDVERALSYVRQVNPAATVLQLSATTGKGFDVWLDWIVDERRHQAGREGAGGQSHAHDEVATLRARVTELEARLAARG
jgi:hydrogenase nickel incorporation protein HypB